MFTKAELNYHINEKKFLAAKKAIKFFYIYVKPVRFILRTDNKCFPTFVKNKFDKSVTQTRLLWWQQWFDMYQFDVEAILHIKILLLTH